MNTGIVIACLAIGAVSELVALQLNLWTYRRAWLRGFSVIVVFGLVFGLLSTLVSDQPLLIRFAAGSVVGITYEAANLRWLKFFTFQEPLSLIRSRLVVILTAGIPWGIIPAVASPLGGLGIG